MTQHELGDQTYSAVVGEPVNSLVVWQDTRQGTSRIYATRVLSDGTVRDTNGIAVSVQANETRPRVVSDQAGFRLLWSRVEYGGGLHTIYSSGRVDTAGSVSHVADWFAVYGPPGHARDVVYGSGPELLLIFSCWTDTALGRYYGSDRLWARLGDVPGIEQGDSRQATRVAEGATIATGLRQPSGALSPSDWTSGVVLSLYRRDVVEIRTGCGRDGR